MRELKTKNVMPQLAVRERRCGRHAIVGAAAGVPRRLRPAREHVARDRDARLRGMVDRYIDFVARVLRNAGTPDAEIDDEVQRTFITAARRLDDVRPGAEKGFLFKIALNLAAHARRTLARRREVLAEEAPERNETFPRPSS